MSLPKRSLTLIQTGRLHLLLDHLHAVGILAEKFAGKFASGPWGKLDGLWRDFGKFAADFQHYIRSASGLESEAHIESVPGRVDHSTAGALLALLPPGLFSLTVPTGGGKTAGSGNSVRSDSGNSVRSSKGDSK